jgi:hypothetical protein
MLIIIFILSVIILLGAYVIYISYLKINKLEEILAEVEDENSDLVEFISNFNNRLFNDYEHLKEVDRRGSFESDDEVGFVFVTIKSIIEDSFKYVNEYLKSEKSNGEEEKE